MATLAELKDAIANAVATLDDADGSRISTAEAIDSAREILKDAYGVGFEKAVSDALEEIVDDESDDDDETPDDD